MKTPRHLLTERVAAALREAYPDAAVDTADLVVPSQSAEHGDYQCNRALQMAKALKTNPRQVAQSILDRLHVDDLCSETSIAGPGFINLRLSPQWVGEEIRQRLADPRLGVAAADPPRTYVVDFSSPNVAKPMHVGHIRSTIIGDALARTLRFLGNHVIGDNHLGDWGTQFGMMILGYRDFVDPQALEADPIGELKRAYQLVTERSKQDEAYADRARAELAKLQAGDPENRALWQKFIDLSRGVFERLYERLDIHFDTWHGESFYDPMLADTVDDLVKKGIASEDQGALVIFFEEPEGGAQPPDQGGGSRGRHEVASEELRDKPFIVRKKDGAFLYSSSDLAAIRFRVDTWRPDTIVYLVDGRQQLHFKQLFAAARLWGYTDVELFHVWFGTILGSDNKPIKTREGEPIELSALLDEAEERALAIVREKQPDLPTERHHEVAEAVGIGAVKYADLSQARTSDYVFSWDKMLAMQGNTGPYLQYAYVRIRSILEKAGATAADLEASPPTIVLEKPEELALARHLLRFGDALEDEIATWRPNVLTAYLYELATFFSSFYENCPVVQSEPPLRASRLALCHQAARTIQKGLELLGIKTLPRM